MKRETRLMSLLLASACFVSTLSAGSAVIVSSVDAGSEHETLTMSALAPFCNPSRLLDLVH